jgi:hypothetical protein
MINRYLDANVSRKTSCKNCKDCESRILARTFCHLRRGFLHVQPNDLSILRNPIGGLLLPCDHYISESEVIGTIGHFATR